MTDISETIKNMEETIIKVSLIVLFLLYAYFMIGGYTPCAENSPYSKENMHSTTNMHSTKYEQYDNEPFQRYVPSVDYSNKTIYQMGPYLNV